MEYICIIFFISVNFNILNERISLVFAEEQILNVIDENVKAKKKTGFDHKIKSDE